MASGMSRGHFKLIAGVILGVRDDIHDFRSPEDALDEVEHRFTEILGDTNEKFDPHLFRTACQGGPRMRIM